MVNRFDAARPDGHEPTRQAGSTALPPETLPPERLRAASTVTRSYYRWLRLRRLAFAAFMILGFFLVLWLVPWLPGGLDTADYTPELAFTVYLLGGVALTALLVLGFQELARRNRERLTLWSTVYDEATGLHNRTYLYDRLSLECERAKRTGGVFSIIVLQLRIGSPTSVSAPTLSRQALRQVAEVINSLTHPTDLVAMLTGSELAVLAIGVDRESRRALQERLREAVAAELPRLLDAKAAVDVKGGVATYGVDGNDAGTLVQAARTSAVLGVPQRAQAA
jgi:diguanylate cyclase (GGDEF)-like protein